MPGALKPVEWLGDSLKRVKTFSNQGRQRMGYELEMVQHGELPSDWKPLPSIGPGVNEIRVHAEGEYRVFYVAKLQRAIYVLHALEKKTRKTPKQDIELAKDRYREALRREGSKL